MSQRASWIADEYGGSYLNNPEQQNRDLAAAHDMAILIQRTVQNKGGDYQRTGELINETLRELSGRAPFGFVTPAFALGTTQVLLERANQMSGPQFVQYLEGIKDRDNPLFFWQQSTLDPLMDQVKDRTRAHVEQIYGKSTFSVFEGMKGQHGPLAYSAGAADAVLNEVGGGARGMILAASNPVEAGRQVIDMGRNLDRIPQALQQQFGEAQKLIAASQLDDYHKGYLDARIMMFVLDAKDVVETGMSLANLSRKLRNGEVNNIGDAMRALDDGPQAMRRNDGNSPDSPGNPGRTTPQYRAQTMRDVGDAAVASLPAERQPAYRQALDEALQARGITDPERARKFVADLNGAPDGATMQGIHRRAGELIYGRPPQTVSDIVNTAASSAPDNVEWAYQRAIQRTLRDQGIDTPDGAQRYMQTLGRDPAAMQALHQRAYAEVLDNAVKPLPLNAQDYYRRAIDGLAREKGHDSISEVQTYLGNLAGAPNGQSMQAVHNRAYGLLMDDTLQGLPANARPSYREALGEILQERGMNNVSDARGYVDRLNGAPNGQSMQALHNRAYDVMLEGTLRNIPENAQPAYKQTLGQIFQERGLNTLSAQQTYIENLIAAPKGPSMQAVHNRAFGNVVDNAVNALPEAQRPAYRQALREQFSASGVDTVAEAQRYVVDLANSPQTLAKLHDRADAILNPSRTPSNTSPPNTGTQTPDPPNNPPNNGAPNTNPPNNPPNNPGNNGNQTPLPANTPNPETPEPSPQPRLNPASDPDDRLLPYHQRPRAERMDAPDPIEVGGKRYDLVGVSADGQLRLRPESQVVRNIPSEAMFVNGARKPDGSFEQVGREVTYRGESWRFDALASPGWQPGVTERGFGLVDPNNPGRKVFVPADQAGDITMRFAGDNTYRLGDVRHGVIRLQPGDPGPEILHRSRPGDRFEARLEGRELEGVKTIVVGDDGRLSATGRLRNGMETTQTVQPTDLAPRWRDVDSPDFKDKFQVDSFSHREAAERSRALTTEATGLPLRDPNFGTQPETVRPKLSLGAGSLDDQADFIRAQSARIPAGGDARLTVYNIAFNNQGEAQRVLDAIGDFRERHPNAKIEVVAYKPSFDSFQGNKEEFAKLNQFIKDNGVDLKFMEGTTSRQVIHAKGVAVNDDVLFTTGAVIDASRHKADISTPLSREGGAAFRTYFDEAVLGDASNTRRQELAADLARHGVLVNDPVARLPYIARAQDGLIRGADRELFIGVSELKNPDTARDIVRQLGEKPNLKVEIQYREMDPQSQALLQQAQKDYPGRLQVQDVSKWEPRPHFNTIIADGQQAYVGTAYLWPNQQQMIHHGRSFENGVLLQGESVRQLQGQIESLRQLQPPNPGQRLLNPAPENAPDVGIRINNQSTGSVSISAPANTSIGVDVQNSTTGSIQTVSGTGNTQVAGNRDTLRNSTARPDANGNVQTTNEPGLGIVLNHPGSSGNTGTNIRIDNSTVNGSVQSIIGNQNTQIDINEARINGDRRQTVTDGDNNRQTQNLGNNVTAGSVTQTIDGRSDSRQQIGDDVPSPVPSRHTAVEGSISRVEGNRNSAVTTHGDRNVIETGRGGEGVVVNGIQVDTPAPKTSVNPQTSPVDGRLSGGIHNNSTVAGSISVAEGHQNTIVMANGNDNTVQIGRGDRSDDARKLTPVDDREVVAKSGSSHLNGQSVPYTPRFSTQHDLTGEAGGRYTTISGHGVLETDRVIPQIGSSIQRDSFVVPEGVNLHFLGLPGGVITDRLGQRADVGGDLTGVPLLKLGAGDTAPDILITPAFGTINIQGNPITVDNPQGVRLSQLIRDHDLSGNIVVSTCLQQSVSQGNREHWQGITFDLPDHYPKPASPDLSNLPPRLPIDPNFHNQHGLNNTGDGKYTAIGGNAGLSGTNPNTGKSFVEQTFTVPEGVTVYFPSLPGGSVHNRLAEAIEKGEDLSRIPLLKAGAGTAAPDPLLLPGNYEVAGNFVRISDRDGQRLSEVIKEHGLTGNVVVAGGLEGRGKPHSNVLFDVPEQYQQRGMTGGTRGFDLNPDQVVGPQSRAVESPASQPGDQTLPAKDGRQSSLPDTAAPVSGRGDPGLDDPRHPNHTMFASALDRIQTFERGRGIDSGDFARNLAGSLTVSAVESRLPQINHVVFNAEGTRAFAVDTPNLDAEWRRVAYTDVAGAGQQTLAASSERLRELQPPALSPAAVQQDMQQRPDEQARNAARMV